MMKTTRIREKIKKFLGERPRNTAEILEHINSTMRHGTTSQQLGNVLSKDKDIVKVGYIKRSGILSGGYDICEWATRTWVSSNCPGWEAGTPIIIDQDSNNRNSKMTNSDVNLSNTVEMMNTCLHDWRISPLGISEDFIPLLHDSTIH